MDELFWLIRLPATLVIAGLLAVALPAWIALGVLYGLVCFIGGTVAIPVVMINHAWSGKPEAFRRYVQGLVAVEKDAAGWWKPYSTKWSNLGRWQETGR